MAKIDFYKILNVDPKANLKAIKAAYRQLALKYHPDHNPENPKAAELFNEIRKAYEVLSSTDLRSKYDQSYQPEPVTPPKAEPQPQTTPSGKTVKGKNLRYNLFISFEDVANGCERSIRYIRQNDGEPETVQLKVKVPRGAFQNQRLKISQYGNVDKEGAGDLFVIIHLQNHPIFLKKDLNLRVNVPIRYVDAALGSTIEVPTLQGVRKIKLRICEFENLEYRMQGFGLPHANQKDKGDLIIHCFIEHPTRLSAAERNALQKSLNSWPKGEMMQQYNLQLKQMKES